MRRHAIGIDVGGTKILAGVVRDDGTIVRGVERSTPTESQDELLRTVKDLVDELVDDGVMGIGVAVPGTIDYDRGRCVFAANVPLAGANVRECPDGAAAAAGCRRGTSVRPWARSQTPSSRRSS